ncbi:MAG TPA: glycerophosphodiester phosphodiesterase family protein [Acidimicrobiia bacterium]|nr:glycerophosphodiester phosphodiesterase family protein [Acidimicrobiia bacterium]
MRRIRLLVVAVAFSLFGALFVAVPAATGVPAASPPGEPANTWLARRPLNIAHAGGDLEAPHETMYAFKRAVAVGADALEMDLRLSADGEVMVVHDSTINRTSNGTGEVRNFTVAELQAFDNAYWFVPGCWSCHDRPVEEYTLRGVRTGEVAPPAGYDADDFAIPTLRQVFEEFPDRLLDLEIKDGPDAFATADALAALIDEYDAADQVVVVSFDDTILDHFHAVAPGIDTSPGLDTITAWFGSRGPLPGETSLQVPPTFSGIEVVTEQFVLDAHANDLAVYV